MLFTLPEEKVLWLLRRGRTADVFALLEAHPRLARHRYSHGLTLLHLSSVFAQREVVTRLADLGGDVNARDDSGHSILHLMAYESRNGDEGFAGVVDLLIDRGADVNGRLPSGETALAIALAHGQEPTEFVAALRRNGARCSASQTR